MRAWIEREWIEELVREAGARIGWGPHARASAFRLFDDVDGERPAGQVAREPFGALHVFGRHRLLAVGGEARVHPTEERAQELFRQPLGAVQARKQAPAEDLLDEPRAEARERQELSFLCIGAVGDERVHVGVEVGCVRAEGLDREYETWCDVAPIEDRPDAWDDRVAGRAG